MLKFMHKRDAEGVERLVREHILRGRMMVLKDFGQRRSTPKTEVQD
jgi:hypothetical protein